MQTNPVVEQNKNIKWSERLWNQSGLSNRSMKERDSPKRSVQWQANVTYRADGKLFHTVHGLTENIVNCVNVVRFVVRVM